MITTALSSLTPSYLDSSSPLIGPPASTLSILQSSSHKTACSISPDTMFTVSTLPGEFCWLLLLHQVQTLNLNTQDLQDLPLLTSACSYKCDIASLTCHPLNEELVYLLTQLTLHLPNPTYPSGTILNVPLLHPVISLSQQSSLPSLTAPVIFFLSILIKFNFMLYCQMVWIVLSVCP